MKRMNLMMIAMALMLASSAALAQPLPDDEENPIEATPPPPPDPDPPPPPADTRVAPAVDPEPDAPAIAEPKETRPTAFSIAIGLGYDIPADLQAPNITSVRFRLPSGLTFEPRLEFARAASKTDTGVPPDPETETTTTSTELGVLVRHPLMSNGKVDFEIAGGASLSRSVVNPDMADNDTTTTSFGIFYGIAVGYWFTPHVYLTLTGLNPILSTSSRAEEMGPTITIETSTSGVGLVFDPNIFAMLHLYL
ncbi:MAG TPA: hypothetical protein VM261_26140 [Kofleriaceae bacterium]|nr:hypothetical protein [Kofleriaceae bacterium]